MSEEWCEHIRWEKTAACISKEPFSEMINCWVISHTGRSPMPPSLVPDSYTVCPICGSPRPTPKRKTLAEVLTDAWRKQHCFVAEPLSEAALGWVEEIIDELKGDGFIVDVKDLKACLREGQL